MRGGDISLSSTQNGWPLPPEAGKKSGMIIWSREGGERKEVFNTRWKGFGGIFHLDMTTHKSSIYVERVRLCGGTLGKDHDAKWWKGIWKRR